ncbi:ZBT49-like protein [Mya arenaria]|uniref:ZBT49-like protein n=1 Tax=Mya arenaria TaxID=6604 RepID=A0ABY7FYK0_MYAAR|nr:ZBT49-like protein [Mya arenaria]
MATGTPLSLRYHSDQLNNKVVSMMREFYLTGEFCDVVLHVGSLTIHAHRTVLAAFSPYFRDLFHQPSNKHKTDIMLGNQLRDESVRQLIDFCYSSNITVDSQSADKILTAANILQIKEIEKLCITFLAAQQALKSEAIQPPPPPTIFVPATSATITNFSPSQTKNRSDSRELACADTSGIGSSNNSPRQSSRPSSVPISEQPMFPASSSYTWGRAGPSGFDSFRSNMPSFPGFLFPPLTSAFPLPVTSAVQHQLLMKALTNKTPTLGTSIRGEPLETGEIYSGKYAISGHVKEESGGMQSEGEDSSHTDTLQCHICLKQFETSTALKSHVLSEHKDNLISPALSPYKMISPVRKLSSDTTLSQANVLQNLQNQKDSGESYTGSNMCGTCGKSFRDPQSLKFHRYNHVLRYQCNYCGKRFSRSWNLHRHRKTHVRQLQEAGMGPGADDISPIDVDSESGSGNGNQTTPTYDMEKDLILSSPYADYRNHRHDMMPFAFDLRKTGSSSTYGMEGGDMDRQTDGQAEKESDNDIEQSETPPEDTEKSE